MRPSSQGQVTTVFSRHGSMVSPKVTTKTPRKQKSDLTSPMYLNDLISDLISLLVWEFSRHLSLIFWNAFAFHLLDNSSFGQQS